MDSNTFMGFLIFALIALFGFTATLVALIFKPILKLNSNLTKVNSSLQDLNDTAKKMENRLDKNEQDIDNINRDLRNYEGRISRMEASQHHE